MQFLSHISSRWRRKSMAGLLLGLGLFGGWLPSVNAKSAADYFVHSLPGAPEGVPLLKMYAGHIEIDPAINANLFFWFFENKHLADKSRTVIWLNGGPGCSSEDGALMEIGPYRVREGGKLDFNEGSWGEFANVLFIDNPVGTGFSYVDTDKYVHELSDMANQLILFLDNFFTVFPEYVHDDIYIAGESYAGQHIPYFARAILERNKQKASFKDWDWMDDASYIPYNLKGLLIGNGWISGTDQYPAYLQFAYKHGLLTPGTAEATAVEKQQAICDKSLSDGGKDHVDDMACEQILGEILRVTAEDAGNNKKTCTNMYDVRLTDDFPSCGMNWPPDLAHVTPYLRQDDVKKALHVNPDKKTGWVECNNFVGNAFKAQNSRPSVELLPDLLEQVPIVLFSGEQDLICNHIGTEELINNLEWNGGKGFEISPGVWAPRRAWTFEGEPAGMYQEARNLTYILFYNSSHMVPFDYPRRTRDMLDRFMGVDIGAIGGEPADSRIDGEKGPVTSVGGHPNSTQAEEEQDEKLKEAEWRAYQRSGEVALVIVAIAAAVWGWFVWRARRRHAGYLGVSTRGDDDSSGGGRVPVPVWRRGAKNGQRDVEAADFDENELENLAGKSHGAQHDMERERYSLGDDSEDEEGRSKPQANGHGW